MSSSEQQQQATMIIGGMERVLETLQMVAPVVASEAQQGEGAELKGAAAAAPTESEALAQALNHIDLYGDWLHDTIRYNGVAHTIDELMNDSTKFNHYVFNAVKRLDAVEMETVDCETLKTALKQFIIKNWRSLTGADPRA